MEFFFLALCLALYIFSLLPDQSSMFVRPQPYIIVLGAKATLAPSPFCGHQYTHSYYMDNKVQVPQESGLHMRRTRRKASQRKERDGTSVAQHLTPTSGCHSPSAHRGGATTKPVPPCYARSPLDSSIFWSTGNYQFRIVR